MGCHTWYKKVVDRGVVGDEKTNTLVNTIFNNLSDQLTQSEKEWYRYAIDQQLVDPILSFIVEFGEFAHEQFDGDYDAFMLKFGEDYRFNSDYGCIRKTSEWVLYDDAIGYDGPRISGYPDIVITSYDEMMEFIKTGFVDSEGIHHTFSDWDVETNKHINGASENSLRVIRKFFDDYPDGIIEFG